MYEVYSVGTALFWVITQRVEVISYHVSGQTVGPVNFRPLKMGPTGYPEKSVRNYHYSLCNNPEERSSQLLGGGSLTSGIRCV